MAMSCTICNNPNRLEIDKEIVKGGSLAKIAKNFDFNYNAVYNHANNHISTKLATAYEKRDLAQNFDLLQRIDNIISRAEEIFLRNYKNGKDVVALKALDSQRNTIELLAKISYSLHQAKQAELELARQQSGEISQDDQAKQQKSLGILTTNELRMLMQLNDKMQKQDKSIIVIPDEPNQFKSALKRRPYVEDDIEEVEEVDDHEPHIDYFEHMRVRRIPAEEIPSSSNHIMVRARRK